jgi:hypothetical protein
VQLKEDKEPVPADLKGKLLPLEYFAIDETYTRARGAEDAGEVRAGRFSSRRPAASINTSASGTSSSRCAGSR